MSLDMTGGLLRGTAVPVRELLAAWDRDPQLFGAELQPLSRLLVLPGTSAGRERGPVTATRCSLFWWGVALVPTPSLGPMAPPGPGSSLLLLKSH